MTFFQDKDELFQEGGQGALLCSPAWIQGKFEDRRLKSPVSPPTRHRDSEQVTWAGGSVCPSIPLVQKLRSKPPTLGTSLTGEATHVEG